MKKTVIACDGCGAELHHDDVEEKGRYFHAKLVGTHFVGEECLWDYCLNCWNEMVHSAKAANSSRCLAARARWRSWLMQWETKDKTETDFGAGKLDAGFASWWEIVGSAYLSSREEAAVALTAGYTSDRLKGEEG